MGDDDVIALGKRIQEMRKMRSISMRELAANAGVSAGYISQIENGQANASLQVIRAIADVFGVHWLDLFETKTIKGRLLKGVDRPSLIPSPGVRHFRITQPPLANVEVLVSEYAPGETVGGEDYVHGDSQEIFMVMEGKFRFWVGGDEYELEKDDSIEFRTSTPHMLKNIDKEWGKGVWIVTPPSSPHWKATIDKS